MFSTNLTRLVKEEEKGDDHARSSVCNSTENLKSKESAFSFMMDNHNKPPTDNKFTIRYLDHSSKNFKSSTALKFRPYLGKYNDRVKVESHSHDHQHGHDKKNKTVTDKII